MVDGLTLKGFLFIYIMDRCFFSSVQHAADTTLSAAGCHPVSRAASGSAAVHSESAMVVDAGLRQRQSAEEQSVELDGSQSVQHRNAAVATRRNPLTLRSMTRHLPFGGMHA